MRVYFSGGYGDDGDDDRGDRRCRRHELSAADSARRAARGGARGAVAGAVAGLSGWECRRSARRRGRLLAQLLQLGQAGLEVAPDDLVHVRLGWIKRLHGFPRIGRRRELKTALEVNWSGKIDTAALARARTLTWDIGRVIAMRAAPRGGAAMAPRQLKRHV